MPGNGDRTLVAGTSGAGEVRGAVHQLCQFDPAQAPGRSRKHRLRGVLVDRRRRRGDRPGDHGRLRRFARGACPEEMTGLTSTHRKAGMMRAARILCLLLSMLAGAAIAAGEFPTKSIRVVVAYPPGG